MIGPTTPFRLLRPRLIKKQSAPFISSHLLPPGSPSQPAPTSLLAKIAPSLAPAPPSPSSLTPPHLVGRPHRFGEVGTPGTPWEGKTRLAHTLFTYSPVFRPEGGKGKVPDSPFLPRRGRGKRYIGPEFGRAERARVCKEAFMWRLAYAQHVGAVPAPPPSRSTFSHLNTAGGEFSWGGLTKDPVPAVVKLLGGDMTLTPRERRWLGLPRRDPENEWGGRDGMRLSAVAQPTFSSSSAPTSSPSTSSTSRNPTATPSSAASKTEIEGEVIPKYRSLSHTLGFGPYREKPSAPFKGTIRERGLKARREGVAKRMEGMEQRVKQHREAMRESRAKKRAALPF